MSERIIAIVGMGCRYPDARSPMELWENVLAQRRAFRRMPAERLRLEDYPADPALADSVTTTQVAVIEGYEFDRAHFRTAGGTYRETDLTHWLALDIASQALADAGFTDGKGLPRDTTGVVVGNTLTGEFSRANVMRLRWPYVRRVVDAELAESDWPVDRRHEFLAKLEERYKAPFPPVGGETLAGGLSNTIAGRICNHFDLHGGGYTVDGACASSLLAVTTACTALATGDLDVVLAGGVDLSLDPFELIGFSRVGVLAQESMRVYDAHATGFWPGEGCGFVVLMSEEAARRQGRRIYGLIRGWGVASDGSGGTTRPETAGQLLALNRAYRRAGFGAETVGYFEGHGTGTEVGDQVEIETILQARSEARLPSRAALGSIKANIGHTKAAAGVAGFIKATMSVHTQIVPPLAGQREPPPRLKREDASLTLPRTGELWPPKVPLRAAVSAMGFGGIDTHVVIEGVESRRKDAFTSHERALISTPQDAELFLLNASSPEELQRQLTRIIALANRLSIAELSDVASALHRSIAGEPWRAAVIASTPQELVAHLSILNSWISAGVKTKTDATRGIALGSTINKRRHDSAPRIGFLFPGQGSPSHVGGGIWFRRFEAVRALYDSIAPLTKGDPTATEVAQPAIVVSSLAALRLLTELGIRAEVSVGHSLGEITAYHWAGAFDDAALVRIAAARGRAMTELATSNGAMASVAAAEGEVRSLIGLRPVVIAGLNGPRRTVISGDAQSVAEVVVAARAKDIGATRLSVSHAFHSPLVGAAIPALRTQLERETFHPLERRVLSTVSGSELDPKDALRELMCRQVTDPVRFSEALGHAINEIDLWLEVGPGCALTSLVSDLTSVPVIALDAGSESLSGLLRAAGTVYALGGEVQLDALFAGRFSRPFDLDRQLRFFANPCEEAPISDGELPAPNSASAHRKPKPEVEVVSLSESLLDHTAKSVDRFGAALEVVRRLVAEQVELPVAAVGNDDRLLADLHLNSITVGQLAVDGARRMGLPRPADPMSFAGATVAELARGLIEIKELGEARATRRTIEGIGPWVRPFVVRHVKRERPMRPRPAGAPDWRVLAPEEHPLAAALEKALGERGAGRGIVVCLPADPGERHIALLLEGARAALGDPGTRFVLVQQGGGGGAFVRCLHRESRNVATCIVNLPFNHPEAVDWVIAEAVAALGYHEAIYDRDGCRREPVLALLDAPPSPAPRFEAGEVLLVTGGGKGIAAECALSLAREYGLRLGLVGRSNPATDPVLAANLERVTAAGLEMHYVAADVTDLRAIQAAVVEITTQLGPIAAVLHGAGINEPRPLSVLTEEIVRRTLATKLDGARNVMAALNPQSLRLFVAFSSIIARTGLRGEADYGLANEWLTAFVERFQSEHPACRCLAVEWSVWSGVGMGESLGRLDALIREGITPISPEVGLQLLSRLIRTELPGPAVVVAGRIGEASAVAIEQPALPLQRFLGRPVVYYPEVELVVETEISAENDPYLRDHLYQGMMLLPAVLGLEAMAQVAMAVVGSKEMPAFEAVSFRRPVQVPNGAAVTIRLAALAGDDGSVDVALRSSESEFHVNHFEARCRFRVPASGMEFLPARTDVNGLLPLDPGRDLYDGMLFQRGRFQRVRGYRLLRATECLAEIAEDASLEWFGPYRPNDLVLGDPGSRDAAIHSIQACVPHATVLPTAAARIVPGDLSSGGPWAVYACERAHEGNRYVYDMVIAGADGRVRERWEGLELRAMAGAARLVSWPWPLLGPYIERRIGELLPGSALKIALSICEHGRHVHEEESDRAIGAAFGRAMSVSRSPNGKPEVVAELDVSISASHSGPFTLAIGGAGPVGCDLERVVQRTDVQWNDLLDVAHFGLAKRIARESASDLAGAATRVWAAHECLKKAGWIGDAPLALAQTTPDGWIVLSSGSLRIATYIASIGDDIEPSVVAVLARSHDAVL